MIEFLFIPSLFAGHSYLQQKYTKTSEPPLNQAPSGQDKMFGLQRIQPYQTRHPQEHTKGSSLEEFIYIGTRIIGTTCNDWYIRDFPV